MLLQVTTYSFVLLSNAIVLLLIGIYLYRRKAVKGALFVALAMFATALWSLFGALESSVFGLEMKVIASQITYVGIAFAGPLWLLFALEFAQIREDLHKILRSVLIVSSMLIIIAVLTNGAHYLVWRSWYQIGGNGYSPVIYIHGPIFFVNLYYQYATLAIGAIILFVYGVGQKGAEKKHIFYSLFGVLVPWAANIYYVFAAKTMSGYDLTPFAFAFTGIALTISLFSNRYFELLSAAKEKVLDSITSGIVITNDEGAVIEMNRAAREMLGKDVKLGSVVKGKGIFIDMSEGADVYIKKVNKWLEIEQTQLVDAVNGSQGAIYYLHDISRRKAEREKIQKSEYLYSSILNFFPNPVFVIDTEGKVLIWNKAMEEMTKISADIMIGKGSYAYAVPFYGKKRPMIIDLVLNEMSVKDYYAEDELEREGETITVTLEGNGQAVLCIAKPLYDQYGHKIGAIEIIRDITAQKKAERELKERVDTLHDLNGIMMKREKRLSELSEKMNKAKKIK